MNELLNLLIEKHDKIEEEYENCLDNSNKDWLEGQFCAYENIIHKLSNVGAKIKIEKI